MALYSGTFTSSPSQQDVGFNLSTLWTFFRVPGFSSPGCPLLGPSDVNVGLAEKRLTVDCYKCIAKI